MTVNIEIGELSRMLSVAAENGAARALEKAGITKATITMAEVKKLYGKDFAYAARKSIHIKWIPVGSAGRTSGCYALKEDVDKFLFERKFNFNQ